MINIKIGFWKMIWRPLALGILAGTIPGFYIGKILPWIGKMLPWKEEPLLPWFLVATVILAAASLFVSIQLLIGMYRTLAGVGTVRLPFWAGYFLVVLFLFSAGCFLAGYFWWATGRIALDAAKKDVLDSGYHWGPPENAPFLPDNKNSVYLFNQAWNAPSMRRFGSPKPIFDNPPNGRFTENTQRYKPQEEKNDFSNRPFFGKKYEDEFLISFNQDAIEGRLTQEEKKYARLLVKEHEDAFYFTDKAFQAQAADWGIDYRVDPWAIPIPKETYFLTLARLIRVRALVQAMDGDTRGAVKSLETGFLLADVSRQAHNLIGEMISMAVRKIMISPLRYVLLRPHAGRGVEADILRYLPQKKWEKEFDDSMQYEFFNRQFSFEKVSWLGYLKENRWGAFTYPFMLFDRASEYEVDLQFMKNLRNPPEVERLAERYQFTGWLLGSIALPRFNQMFEKTNETLTQCGLAKLQILADLFRRKHGRWPENEEDLRKICRQYADGLSGELPEVLVSGVFVKGAKSPSGNKVTLAEKGETPTASGSGWLYDSNFGTVYVNSTVKDSKAVPYSFYGFE